jgi:hypothetical protein
LRSLAKSLRRLVFHLKNLLGNFPQENSCGAKYAFFPIFKKSAIYNPQSAMVLPLIFSSKMNLPFDRHTQKPMTSNDK